MNATRIIHTFTRLAYRDVGIVYKDEALPRDPA